MPVGRSGKVRRLAAVAMVAVWTSAAHADEKSVCADAHVHAQELRQSGKLRAARSELNTCAAESCPALVKKDCAQWVQDVGAAVPSIVVEARDERGAETVSVEVVVDGERVADHLDGRAIEVDPGEHVFQFRAPTGVVIMQRTLIREGEHMRRLVADFQPPKPAPTPAARASAAPPRDTPPPGERSSVLPFVFGGVGVVALGAFTTFAILGRNKQSELERCRPTCSLDDVGVMRTHYLVADISLGTAVVAGGLAVYFALAHRNAGARAAGATAWGF